MRVVSELQETGALPRRWRLAAAQPTYNPLGRDLTFLSAEDVAEAVTGMSSRCCYRIIVVLQCHDGLRTLSLEPCALPQDLVCTTYLGHVREAVLARALREAVLVDAPLVEDGAAERRGDVLECLTPCRTAEVRKARRGELRTRFDVGMSL